MAKSGAITEYRLSDHAKVDVDRNPPEVVTVYRTSKIEKYWRVDS